MQTLEVTDEQYAFIQHLREEISEDVVGRYGFVRERDAVQFLIDNLDEDVEIDNEIDATAPDDVATSVAAAISGGDPAEPDVVAYDEEADVPGGDEDDAADESADEQDAADGTDPEPSEDGADPASEEDAAEEDVSEQDAGDGSANDDDMLDEMMSLLETHDDKWEEADSADYRYTVTLPDGSTEDVQTKDDVRALLFKNYR